MNLFDSFPKEMRGQQVTSWIIPGAILRLHCSWIEKPNKDKYLVVGAVQPDFLMLMVNTEARYSAQGKTQVALRVSDYAGVLTTDCFVNCSTVVTEFTYQGTFEQLVNDGNRYRGNLRPDDRYQLIAAIKYAVDISPVHQGFLVNELD